MNAHVALVGAILAMLSGGCSDSESDAASGRNDLAGDTDPTAGEQDESPSTDGDAETGESAASDAGPSDAGESDVPGMDATAGTDYGQLENWLCRPGHNDACAVDLDTTVVQADGLLEVEPFEPSADPKVDCFYVYPTVSLDDSGNSDLVPGPEERSVVRAQFARFASECRLFAPMYRQISLTALRGSLAGGSLGADRALGYQDVLAAWKYYLENDNEGRGVVLVGHSQGAGVLTRLLQQELDEEPVDERLISAFIIGGSTLVADGQTVGGTYQNIPLCEADDELGCVVSYVSFRSNTPPSETATFGSSRDPELVAGCTNPAALNGGSGELHAYLSVAGPGGSGTPMPAWVEGEEIMTPFVSVPGMLSAECKFAHTGSFLSVTVHGEPSDPRVDDISGDVVTGGEVQAGWGLHLIDVHLAMGNLVDLVRAKAVAHLAR